MISVWWISSPLQPHAWNQNQKPDVVSTIKKCMKTEHKGKQIKRSSKEDSLHESSVNLPIRWGKTASNASIVDTSSLWRSTQLLNGWTRDINPQRFLIQSLYLQKTSGQGVRMHPPMVLLAMVKRGRYKSVGLLLGIRRLPSSSCEGLYIAPGILFLSLMVRRYFMLLWWHEVAAWSSPPYGRLSETVVGDATVRDRGKWSCWMIMGSDLLSPQLILSLCKWWDVGHG